MRAVALLGAAHERGRGVPVDMEKAILWYERAAALGYPRFLYILGSIYRHGDGGVTPDLVRARAEPGRAAAFDHPPALAEYGSMLTHDEGGPAVPELGVTYLRMSAQMGDSDGMNRLGLLYLHGQHVPQDLEEARQLFAASAVQETSGGHTNLGYTAELGLRGEQDLGLAAASCRAAMDRGSDFGRAWMARLISEHPEFDGRPLAAQANCL